MSSRCPESHPGREDKCPATAHDHAKDRTDMGASPSTPKPQLLKWDHPRSSRRTLPSQGPPCPSLHPILGPTPSLFTIQQGWPHRQGREGRHLSCLPFGPGGVVTPQDALSLPQPHPVDPSVLLQMQDHPWSLWAPAIDHPLLHAQSKREFTPPQALEGK